MADVLGGPFDSPAGRVLDLFHHWVVCIVQGLLLDISLDGFRANIGYNTGSHFIAGSVSSPLPTSCYPRPKAPREYT